MWPHRPSTRHFHRHIIRIRNLKYDTVSPDKSNTPRRMNTYADKLWCILIQEHTHMHHTSNSHLIMLGTQHCMPRHIIPTELGHHATRYQEEVQTHISIYTLYTCSNPPGIPAWVVLGTWHGQHLTKIFPHIHTMCFGVLCRFVYHGAVNLTIWCTQSLTQLAAL